MNGKRVRLLLTAVASLSLLLLLQPAALADTAELTFVSANGQNFGGIYTSPYYLDVADPRVPPPGNRAVLWD